jgi:hypothetical protein
MAGALTISTLNDSSGVLATQNGMTGIAKAWVNFNGTGTPAIRGSFNVSSITDIGTGNYTINFTTAMPNANYAVVTGTNIINTYQGETTAVESITTSSFSIVHAENGTPLDTSVIMASVFSS